MNIVVEGPDCSGKSTLIKALSRRLRMKVVSSPGPVKDLNDFYLRCAQLSMSKDTIFDRHAIVSEFVYGQFRGGGARVDEALAEKMYLPNVRPIFLFCYSDTLTGHRLRPGIDTAQHLRLIKSHDAEIREMYLRWSKEYADVFYRPEHYEPKNGESFEETVWRASSFIADQLRLIRSERARGLHRPAPGRARVPREVWASV